MATTPEPTDLEFPQLWDNYAHIITQRQRMLQSCMAYYTVSDASVRALYDSEVKSGLPHFDHVPTTQGGKNSLARFTSVCTGYTKVLARFRSAFEY